MRPLPPIFNQTLRSLEAMERARNEVADRAMVYWAARCAYADVELGEQ